ncbi:MULTISPECIES: hypothetical protein [Pantoea]|nr:MULTISPECIES: hypothetical protein [Pantoea]
MKLHDYLGLVGFGMLIAAAYLRWGIVAGLAVAGSGMLITGLALARKRGQ